MIVTQLKPDAKSDKVKVYIDGEYHFFLKNKELIQYKLEEEQAIDEGLYDEIVENTVYPAAKEKALSILGYSDKTEREMKNKLKQAGYTDIIISKVIAYLGLYGYIDDERYARAIINSSKQKKSKPAIIAQLLNKGIGKDIINRLMYDEYHEDDSADDELIAIRRSIAKKTSDVNTLDFSQKHKLIASLYRKGFDLEKIKRLIDN